MGRRENYEGPGFTGTLLICAIKTVFTDLEAKFKPLFKDFCAKNNDFCVEDTDFFAMSVSPARLPARPESH